MLLRQSVTEIEEQMSTKLVRSVVHKNFEVDNDLVLDSSENHVVLDVDKDLPPTLTQREDIHQNSLNDQDETS